MKPNSLNLGTLVLLFFLVLGVEPLFASRADSIRLEHLKEQIQRATFSDSATIFNLGNQAISLANKLNRKNEIGYVYQHYGSFFYYANAYEQADFYFNKSLEIAKKYNDENLLITTKIRMNFMVMDEDINKAKPVFQQLLEKAQKGKHVAAEVMIHNAFGILYETILMDDKATKSYLKGLKIAEKHNLKYETAFVLNNLALLKLRHKNYNSAKIDLERALELATETNQPRLRLNVLNNLGLVNRRTNNIKESVEHYKETVKEATKLGFPGGVTVAYINLGGAYFDQKDMKMALNYADSALQLAHTYRNYEQLKNGHLIKGQVYITLSQFKEAKKSIDSIKFYQKIQLDPKIQTQLYDLQSRLHLKMGDFKGAYDFEVLKNNLNDSILQINNERELANLQAIYGKERMENELNNLNQRNKILEAETQLKTVNQRLLLLSLILAFITIITAIYVLNVRKARKIKNQFSQNLIEQIDEERSRISKDLHDDIGQSLVVIKTKLNLFANNKIDQINGLDLEIGEIIEKTRVLSHQIHPAALEKIGLEKALTELLNKTQNATDLICSLDYDLVENSLPMEVSAQIYRIIQECISNTIKHAHASALKVQLYCIGNDLIVKYRDNGIGITSTQANSGTALLTIRERIAIIGGKLELRAGQKSGIVIKITIKNEGNNS